MKTELNAARVSARTDLTSGQREQMFRLRQEHFVGITRPQFETDLAEKNRVILVEQGGRLVRFSTLLAYETVFEGEAVSVIYSGDTIIQALFLMCCDGPL